LFLFGLNDLFERREVARATFGQKRSHHDN